MKLHCFQKFIEANFVDFVPRLFALVERNQSIRKKKIRSCFVELILIAETFAMRKVLTIQTDKFPTILTVEHFTFPISLVNFNKKEAGVFFTGCQIHRVGVQVLNHHLLCEIIHKLLINLNDVLDGFY